MDFAVHMFLDIVSLPLTSFGENSAQAYDRIAPLVDEVSVKYHLDSFDGAFLKENIFRQDASPDVDAAWDSLGVNCKSRPKKCLRSSF